MEKNTGTVQLMVVLLLIAFVSEEMIVGSEGRTCETQSHRFKGACLSDGNCGNVCRTEGGGFTGGVCRGFRHRCFCTRPCTTT